MKPRGSSDKENSSGGKVAGGGGSKVIRGPSRRQSSASVMAREKQPSKDGTAQRNAKEVEGLKDFVSAALTLGRWTVWRGE